MAKNDMFSTDAYIEGIRAQVDRSTLVPSDWMQRNFRHPKNNRLPWSFEDHEFQIEIVNCGDDVPVVWVEKCAQIGLSTVQILSILTFLATHDFLKAAYVLPTAKFATEFSALRMDPMINEAPVIKSMISSETDNVGMKKVGTCFLVMRGTTGENQAISIDLDSLVIDEMNFCNQKILSAFSSRMQHSLLKLRRNFSTPTLPEFGVSAGYDQSTAALRAVFCDHCSKWVFPDFFNDVVIPGFDKGIALYRKGDHEHPGVASAYLACPSCRGELTIDNLNNPDKRAWVHRYPDRPEKGYKVCPWDVPKYNPIPEVLYSIKDYNYQDWNNYRLGISHESSENSFLLEVIKRNSVVRPVSIDALRSGNSGVHRVFIGSDLGKTNHFMVGVASPDAPGVLDIVCCAKVDTQELVNLYGEVHYGRYLEDLFRHCLGVRLVVDHMPEWATALYLGSRLGEGQSFGAYYVGPKTGQLDIYAFDNKKCVVNIQRDGHFDDVVAAANGGKIRFPYADSPEMELVYNHLKVIKKVKEVNSKGQTVETWTSTSDEDHYGHALGYLWAAYSSVEGRFEGVGLILPPAPSGVRMR